MDWWPTFGKLAGLEAPPHDWKDNDGKPTSSTAST
jgi:arylsulfatase